MRRFALLALLYLAGGATSARAADARPGDGRSADALGSATTADPAAMAAAAIPADPAARPMDEVPLQPNVRGAFRTIGSVELLRYKSSDTTITRHGTDLEADLRQYASIQAIGLGDPRISAVASARWQLDAVRPPQDSELRDLSDAEPARRHLKLFEAYVEARDLGDHVTVRAGRQSVSGFAPVFLDGGRIDLTSAGIFRATGYGGYRASQYSGTDDRPIAGGEVGARPLEGLDIVAGYFHYVADDYGLEVRDEPVKDLSFLARVEGIGGGISEVGGEARGRLAPAGLELRLGYTRWFATPRFPYDYTFERAPATGVTRLLVGARTDGNEARAEVVFDKLGYVVASVRGRIYRPVKNDRDPYNLGYEEVSPSLETYDLPWAGLETDLAYIHYTADTGVPTTIDPTTVEGFTDLRGEGISRYDEVILDVWQRFGRKVRAGVGGIYRIESYEDRFGRLTNVKAYDAHGEVRWLATDRWTFIARYDYAQDLDIVNPVVAWDQRVQLEVRYAF